MKRKHKASLACLSAIAIAGSGPAAAGDPGDATAPVPSTIYRSPFADYRALGEDKNQSWIESNDTVRRIGGWRAYAKEAAEANKAGGEKPMSPTAPTTPSVPSVPTTPPPHQHKHGG